MFVAGVARVWHQYLRGDRSRLKSAICRRAWAPKALNALDGPDAIDPASDGKENEAPEPMQSKSVTARGRGRHRCTGRKRKEDAESEDQPSRFSFKGADNHGMYQDAVKRACAYAARELTKNGKSKSACARMMRDSLGDEGITVGLRQCHHHINVALENNGTAISPQKPGGVYIPYALEKSIASTMDK